jgi:hypothetical protein
MAYLNYIKRISIYIIKSLVHAEVLKNIPYINRCRIDIAHAH